jgi:outer membrane protein assembly factor BamB
MAAVGAVWGPAVVMLGPASAMPPVRPKYAAALDPLPGLPYAGVETSPSQEWRMSSSRFVVCVQAAALTLASQAHAQPAPPKDSERFWPQWRGPLMTGVAPQAKPPLDWSETRNVRWKVEIPGRGSATPVVWGDRIYVLTAVPTGKRAAAPAAVSGDSGRGPRGTPADSVQEFTALALDRRDGKVIWRRVVRQELPHEGTHATGSWASASAATDGELLFAHFGSRGLYALDREGKVVWEKDLGDMNVKLGFGEGSSPALAGERLFVQWDHEGDSFIVALDRRTGRELWRQQRDERTSWASPLVVEHGGAAQVVTSATNRVRSYDAASGRVLWQTPGMTQNAIPTPVHADGLVFLTSGFRGNALLAVRLAEARGELDAAQAVAWKTDRDTPYVPSPLLWGGELYVLKGNNGLLSAFNAKTGERLYGPERLEGVPNVYASPLGADGRIYVAGREGTVAVVQRGAVFKLLAANTLDDGFDASPVAVGSELYLRGNRFLYRISE